MRAPSRRFVLGLDLDGCCADFYGYMREVAAEWTGVKVEDLTPDVTYGMPEWGLLPDEYDRLHRFAVTQRGLFENMPPIQGAPQSIRRLGTEGSGSGSLPTGSSSDGSTRWPSHRPCGG
jgi:5' nucleotidase, deoxy (Pyrimidine), cytosolic type C protein (NT5C)